MHFVTTYTFKPFLTREETKELMDMFATAGEAPGTTAHYVFADGGGGILVGESDDLTASYRNILNYNNWMEFSTQVVLPVDEAVGQVLDYLS